MKTRPLLVFILFLFVVRLQAQSLVSVKIENGVSEDLAAYRKSILSNVHYQLQFDIAAQSKVAIEGQETISFNWMKNAQPLQIDFKANASQVHRILVNKNEAMLNFQREHIIIDNRFLTEGQNKITIDFTAGDLSLNRNNDFLYTLLVPDRARTVFPCFDQPNLKARYQLSLALPKEWKAMGNAPLLDSIVEGNKKTYRYRESDLFSTYLFSFVAGKFQQTAKDVSGRTMQFLYRETDSNKIRLSLDTIFGWHAKAIQFLEDYTQIPFPFQKLGFAGIPDFQYGGMEHVGAIDYKASTLFLDSSATNDQENARSNLIAHETSHMWFGDLVTMQWFNDVWMKEVFANFMADKITQGTQSSDNYELKFLLTHFPRAYAVDRTAGANPIRQSLSNLQEAGNLYGAIIYDKAPVMMRQLERLMGAEAFRDGLREYLKKYQFSNATWPNLIEILDRRTAADLQAWNKVWVNTPGRPQFTYSLQQKNGKVSKLIITQKGEQSSNYLLPQFFEVALIYKDRIEEVTVNMNKAQVEVKAIEGKNVPEYILFNSSGQGYGVFPIDKKGISQITLLKSPVMRASAFINLYENMLNGTVVQPEPLFSMYQKAIGKEPEELISNLLSSYTNDIFWHLITPQKRKGLAKSFEKRLWEAMQQEPSANKKKILFRSFQSYALNKPALDSLYQIWKTQTPPPGLRLNEEDYTSLALNLTLKLYPDTNILNVQQSRITNPDRKQRLEFLRPALSADVNERDQFFASLKNSSIRKKEAWVQDALAYLHHPLRTFTSIRYLKQSLDMLQEIQRTGDIFFPAAWLNTTFGNYQTKDAADIVRKFLQSHPNYNPKLKAKILQAADPLFRAEKLIK